MVGRTSSTIVTVKLADATCPALSEAVQVTAVVPNRNTVPDGGVHEIVTGGSPPDEVALKETIAFGKSWLALAKMVISAGTVIFSGTTTAGVSDTTMFSATPIMADGSTTTASPTVMVSSTTITTGSSFRIVPCPRAFVIVA